MKRARLIYELLNGITLFRCVQPTGAFYAFPDVSACFGRRSPGGRTLESAAGFAEALLEEAKVAVVPGEDFGEASRSHIRISFACDDDTLREGIRRIKDWVEALS